MSGRDLVDACMRAARHYEPPPPLSALEHVRGDAFRRAAVPVLIEGFADEWPGRANLSLSRLRQRFGERVVSGSLTKAGRIVCDVRSGLSFVSLRLGAYVERLERGDWPEAYLHGPGETWLPELRDDLTPPPCYDTASWRTTRFWLSAPEMSTPLHQHAAENVFVQLLGRKRFYLYPPAASPWLYSNPLRSALPNYSRFDPECPDYDEFPLARAIQPFEAILNEGDAIYLPSGWWHQVRSLDVSFSVNFFFAAGLTAALQRITEIVKRVRGLEIYGLQQRLRTTEPS